MEYCDDDRNRELEKGDEREMPAQNEIQKGDNRASVTSRPNIDVISKRNEEEAKLERRSYYKTAGIAVLLVIVVMCGIYFFS